MVSVLEILLKRNSFIHIKLIDCVAFAEAGKDCPLMLLPTNALVGPGRKRERGSMRGTKGTRKWLLGSAFIWFTEFCLTFNHLDTCRVDCEHADQGCLANTHTAAPFPA